MANEVAAPEKEDFATLLEESFSSRRMRVGEIVEAEVVAVGHDHVTVNAGLKSESIIPASEFMDEEGRLKVKPGDQVEVMIEAFEDGAGATLLSREKAEREVAWRDLECAMNEGTVVKGRVLGRVKGGLTVLIGGIRAFLPGSLVDVRPIKDFSSIEGQDVDVKIVKMDRPRNNLVVSRRAVLEETLKHERDHVLQALAEGAVVRGVVKNITDYGAFVDLGGVDGLLHITDLAWRRVRHPSEVLSVGDEIEVRVLRFEPETGRVSLGLKQMGEDPWAGLSRRYPQGTRVFGRVTNVTDYGAFVEIEPGIEGLVHMSEMDWTNKNIHPSKVVQPGDEVEVMVLDVDENKRRISLGIKQCKPNPWEEFALEHKKADIIRGVVNSVTDFGIFVGLPGGIDGLVHVSDLVWEGSPEEVLRTYHKGMEVEAMLLDISPERERISLGIKQMQGDPFTQYLASHEKGQAARGEVVEVEPKGASLRLATGVDGYLKASEFRAERTEDLREHLKPGDRVEGVIVYVDKKNRVIQISARAREAEEQAGERRRLQEESQALHAGTTNLGALLQAKLEEKSEKLPEKEPKE